MQNEYIVSSECISAIIHRLSLSLGDFEGLLYGTKKNILSSKLKDDGTYETKSVTTVHNVFIFTTQKILFSSSLMQENLQQCPIGMQVVGWVAGRREVPPLISLCDHSTFANLLDLVQTFPTVISNELIFAVFVSKKIQASSGDIEIGKSALIAPFDFKFFNANQDFSSIKIEIENLNETQSKYNPMNFTHSLVGNNSENLLKKVV